MTPPSDSSRTRTVRIRFWTFESAEKMCPVWPPEIPNTISIPAWCNTSAIASPVETSSRSKRRTGPELFVDCIFRILNKEDRAISAHEEAASHVQRRTRNEARFVGGEKRDRRGDIGGDADPADGDTANIFAGGFYPRDGLHRTLDAAGCDAIDGHAGTADLRCEHTREADHRGLRSRVRRSRNIGPRARGLRGNVDDTAPAPLLHDWRRFAAEQERAG